MPGIEVVDLRVRWMIMGIGDEVGKAGGLVPSPVGSPAAGKAAIEPSAQDPMSLIVRAGLHAQIQDGRNCDDRVDDKDP